MNAPESTRPIRRNRDVNFGDSATLVASKRQSLAWVTVDEADAFTVYASARVNAPPNLLPFIVPTLAVTWGHGGASLTTDYPVAGRFRLPLAASTVRVEARLVDLRTQLGPSRDVFAEVHAFIARGTVADTREPTRTVVATGDHGMLVTGPERLCAMRGFNLGSGLWMMLFDTSAAIALGDVPAVVVPAPAMPNGFSYVPQSPRSFFAGVAWAASEDPFMYVPPRGTPSFRIEVELAL